MSSADIITLPKLIAKLPSIASSVPGMLKGLMITNNTDKTKPVGLGLCVEEATQKNPNGIAIIHNDTQLTYSEFNQWSNRYADYLLSLGVKKGDTVVIFIENRPELMACITACAKVGAINAMVNTSQRGSLLVHSCNLVNPTMAIVGEELIDAFIEVEDQINIDADKKFYLADQNTLQDTGTAPAGWQNLADVTKNSSSANPISSSRIYLEDPCFYIYTSGTTGLPKAVIFNHGRWMKTYAGFGISSVRLTSTDRMYMTLPLYHATGMCIGWGSVLAGTAGLVMCRKFSASRFWDDIRQHNVTSFAYVGELCRYLNDHPEKANDLDNKVHTIVGNGMRPNIWKEFKERFGIDSVVEFYASSEGNVGFTNVFNFDNTVGYSPMTYAIVKYDKDKEEPILNKKGYMIKASVGEPGLLIGEVSEKAPFHGYTESEKTEKCLYRNVFKKGDVYFNTGDLMRNIGFKHAQFVDRLGDTFRWKGENVSTTQVENCMDDFVSITESVTYGVEVPNTNGRAGMSSVRLDSTHSDFNFKELLDYLKLELPSYAIPLFLRINEGVMDTTGTFKHKKSDLKEQAFDLNKQDSVIYALLPGENTYSLLTPEVQTKIEAGEFRY